MISKTHWQFPREEVIWQNQHPGFTTRNCLLKPGQTILNATTTARVKKPIKEVHICCKQRFSKVSFYCLTPSLRLSDRLEDLPVGFLLSRDLIRERLKCSRMLRRTRSMTTIKTRTLSYKTCFRSFSVTEHMFLLPYKLVSRFLRLYKIVKPCNDDDS